MNYDFLNFTFTLTVHYFTFKLISRTSIFGAKEQIFHSPLPSVIIYVLNRYLYNIDYFFIILGYFRLL